MPDNAESFPNFRSQPDSPDVADEGVQIAVKAGPHSLKEPIVLRGAYKMGPELVRRAQGAPMAKVILILFRRDETDLWVCPVADASTMPVAPAVADGDIPAGFREGGFFNLDLTALYDRLKPGGKYWIMAAMGDYVSDRIEFAIKPPEKPS